MEEQSRLAENFLNQIADAVIYINRSGAIIGWNLAVPRCLAFLLRRRWQSVNLIVPEHLRTAHWSGFDAVHQAGGRICRCNELARFGLNPTYRCTAPRADRHGGTRQARLARVPLVLGGRKFAGLDGSEDGGLVRAGRLGGLGKGVLHGVAYRDAAAGVVVARSPATIGPMVLDRQLRSVNR